MSYTRRCCSIITSLLDAGEATEIRKSFHFFPLVVRLFVFFVFSPAGFRGNRFHYWTSFLIIFSRQLQQMEDFTLSLDFWSAVFYSFPGDEQANGGFLLVRVPVQEPPTPKGRRGR